MDVHIGKAHSNDYECGLCDLKLETSEKLEIHLFTCEIFQCDRCELKEKTLKVMKNHAEIEHEGKTTKIHHRKLDRYNFNQVCSKSYWADEI